MTHLRSLRFYRVLFLFKADSVVSFFAIFLISSYSVYSLFLCVCVRVYGIFMNLFIFDDVLPSSPFTGPRFPFHFSSSFLSSSISYFSPSIS